MFELVAIHYSPWSEKARWALDHYQVPFQETNYVPMLGELALRRRIGRWRGKISVPILLADGEVVGDSFAIAQYLEGRFGETRSLFPKDALDEIAQWNERSEAGLAASRAIVTQRVFEDPAARREAMPRVPKALLGPLTAPVTSMAIGFLRRKYGFGNELASERAVLSTMLENLQGALADGRPYLLGEHFSYADICMAASMQFVRPVTDEYIKLRPASRQAYTNDALCAEYSQLLDWRDKVYESHRRN